MHSLTKVKELGLTFLIPKLWTTFMLSWNQNMAFTIELRWSFMLLYQQVAFFVLRGQVLALCWSSIVLIVQVIPTPPLLSQQIHWSITQTSTEPLQMYHLALGGERKKASEELEGSLLTWLSSWGLQMCQTQWTFLPLCWWKVIYENLRRTSRWHWKAKLLMVYNILS